MNETKKTYVKPAIEGVYLLPDEAVLGGCKTANPDAGIYYCYAAGNPTSMIGS